MKIKIVHLLFIALSVNQDTYRLTNVTFTNCRTEDFGVMNTLNVNLEMRNRYVSKCTSFDSGHNKNAHGFMITDDDKGYDDINIINCTFEQNNTANGGSNLFINRDSVNVNIKNCQFIGKWSPIPRERNDSMPLFISKELSALSASTTSSSTMLR